MNTIFKQDLTQLSRRDFFSRAGMGLLGLFGLPFLGRYERMERINKWPGSNNNEAIRMGRATDDSVPVYDRPSFSGKLKRMYYRDVIFNIDEVTFGDDQPAYNRVWYRVNNEGYAHSGKIQPVTLNLNKPAALIPVGGQLAEVSVPFTDTVASLKDPSLVAYRFYYGTVHWVKAIQIGPKGEAWYTIYDDKFKKNYYARAEHLRLLEPGEIAPISPEVALEEKRIEVWLQDQLVIAYEKNIPVMITKTATGGRYIDGDYSTPTGNYLTSRKRPSRHMASEDLAAANSYDLPGVPWVSYLTKSGISFHGTFWHNDFGKTRSHGCVNLPTTAAQWIYRWTLPNVPFDKQTFDAETGTRVFVL
jgi:lipoprotein-anchoring transpeptidase ErfK/SrfK